MDIRLTGGTAHTDRVGAISSKSYVHRLIIAAALSDGPVSIMTNVISDDMRATVRAVNSLGACAVIDGSSSGYEIRVEKPLTAGTVGECTVDCGESGSTARFILPVAAFTAERATLTGSGKLPQRPMGPLCDALRSAGCDVSDDHLPLGVSGKPKAGVYSIPGNVSSQFISGLLFMLPLLDGDSKIKITGTLESAAYVDMTTDVLARFGIAINKTVDGYEVRGCQKYKGREHINAEGDWSNGAYVMALGALGAGRAFKTLTVTGLDPGSIQGDRAALDIFGRFGIDISPEKDGFTIKSGPSCPVDVDCSQIPDLVPALAAVAAYVRGDSIFRNVGRLRVKECDRVEAVTKMLGAIDVQVDITSGSGQEDMTVHGTGGHPEDRKEIIVDSFNDHRIVMAASAFSFAEDIPVTIKDAMAVNKSYPGFFELVERLGGNVCRLH